MSAYTPYIDRAGLGGAGALRAPASQLPSPVGVRGVAAEPGLCPPRRALKVPAVPFGRGAALCLGRLTAVSVSTGHPSLLPRTPRRWAHTQVQLLDQLLLLQPSCCAMRLRWQHAAVLLTQQNASGCRSSVLLPLRGLEQLLVARGSVTQCCKAKPIPGLG